jgi:hypothetical protein
MGRIRRPAHDKPGAELSRRMFLYRTALQARLVAAAANARPGKTALVVSGSQPRARYQAGGTKYRACYSNLGRRSFRYGGSCSRGCPIWLRYLSTSWALQCRAGTVDYKWIRDLLDGLEPVHGATAETRLLRLNCLDGHASALATLRSYQDLLLSIPAAARFTWTGVKDDSRLDATLIPLAL